jgi:hypothetical protein
MLFIYETLVGSTEVEPYYKAHRLSLSQARKAPSIQKRQPNEFPAGNSGAEFQVPHNFVPVLESIE